MSKPTGSFSLAGLIVAVILIFSSTESVIAIEKAATAQSLYNAEPSNDDTSEVARRAVKRFSIFTRPAGKSVERDPHSNAVGMDRAKDDVATSSREAVATFAALAPAVACTLEFTRNSSEAAVHPGMTRFDCDTKADGTANHSSSNTANSKDWIPGGGAVKTGEDGAHNPLVSADKAKKKLAEDWQEWRYCLAVSQVEHKAYVSTPVSAIAFSGFTDEAFKKILQKANISRSGVQCPRAPNRPTLLFRLRYAIRWNQEIGNAVVTLDWTDDLMDPR